MSQPIHQCWPQDCRDSHLIFLYWKLGWHSASGTTCNSPHPLPPGLQGEGPSGRGGGAEGAKQQATTLDERSLVLLQLHMRGGPVVCVMCLLMLNLLDFDRRSTSACSVVPAADAHATCLPSHSLRTCLHAFCDSCLAAAPVYSLVYSPFTAGLAI